jgi:hypothetical protein
VKTNAAWSVAALIVAALLVQTIVRAQRPGGIDLTSYLLSAAALAHGRSPYLLPTPFPYIYPPTLAFLLIPLAFVPAPVALVVWFGLNTIAAVWSVRRVLLAAHPALAERRGDVAMFLLLFFIVFLAVVQNNLRNGQVNFVVLALCAAAALPARLKPRATGEALAWALAIVVKLVPLVLAPYFLLRRRWTWLAAAAIALALVALLPGVTLGRAVFDVYEQYWRVFLASSLAPRAQPLDFTVAGLIAAVTRTPRTPMLAVSAAAVVVGWILQADARQLRDEWTRPFALYMLAIPLVSPQSEVHHLAFMLPAAALVAVAAVPAAGA